MRFRHTCVATVLSVIVLCAPSLAGAASVSGQGSWETTLQARDLDGNLSSAEAYYDTALNITWLANANYAGTMMLWADANAWAASLDPYNSGIGGWRLPTTVDVDNDGATYGNLYQGVDYGYNITVHSEMSYMFYVTLGNKAFYDTSGNAQAGAGLTNTGPFSNIRANYNEFFSEFYWSATEYAPLNSIYAWDFEFGIGLQGTGNKNAGDPHYAWAVHSGDVGVAVTTSTVPVPAAVWLFGSGLAGLIGFTLRKMRSV